MYPLIGGMWSTSPGSIGVTMEIDVMHGNSPLEIRIDRCRSGLENLTLSGSMKHDGECYFLNFEIPTLRTLSSICFWLEEKRPGLRVSRLFPRYLTKKESRALRESGSEDGFTDEFEWTIKIGTTGVSFLFSAQFEWRGGDRP